MPFVACLWLFFWTILSRHLIIPMFRDAQEPKVKVNIVSMKAEAVEPHSWSRLISILFSA